jgi:RecA/RadA recombinase
MAPVRPGRPSGIAELDALLGSAGIPKGQLTELFGARSSGKTTLAFAILAACTRAGGIGAYVDPTGAFFAPAAAGAGIDMRRLIVVRPRSAAAARRAIDALVRGGACGVVALDCSESPGALQTHHCARLAAQAEKTATALVIITDGGAQAVASFASLRLRARGLTPVWQEGSDAGARLAGCATSIEIAKSRAVAPGRGASIAAPLPEVAGTWPTTSHPMIACEDKATIVSIGATP